MSKLVDKEYYEKNPQYSECSCIKCKEETMRLIGIEEFEDYEQEDKTLFKCDKCGQKAYISVEWLFTIRI